MSDNKVEAVEELVEFETFKVYDDKGTEHDVIVSEPRTTLCECGQKVTFGYADGMPGQPHPHWPVAVHDEPHCALFGSLDILAYMDRLNARHEHAERARLN